MIGERNISKQRQPARTLDPCPTRIKISPGTHVTQFHHPKTRLLPDAEDTVALQMDKIFHLFTQSETNLSECTRVCPCHRRYRKHHPVISNGHVKSKVSLQINAMKFRSSDFSLSTGLWYAVIQH